jgi:TfoX/Sxy family transcriptional regulator of competence genes
MSLRIKSAVFTLNPLLGDYLQAQTSVSEPVFPAHGDCNTSVVAYDEELAQRIRALVADEAGVSEKKMFGGLAFLVGGNMAVAASGQGGLLARVDPAESDRLVQETPAEEMVMRGRAMAGWLRLDSADVATPKALAEWVARSVAYVRSLPAK